MFRRWMELTMEAPARKVIGIPQETNKLFWAVEDKFNHRYIQISNCMLVLNWLVFDFQLFMVSFDVEIVVYIVFQAFHALNGNFFIWSFLFSVYTINVFFIECLWFLSKKFRHIGQQVQHLASSKSKQVYNRDLARLISEFNLVQKELAEINNFFKNFLGHNIIHFFGLAIVMSFIGSKRNLSNCSATRLLSSCLFLLGLFVDKRLKLTVYIIFFVYYFVIIFIPFRFANNIRVEVRLAGLSLCSDTGAIQGHNSKPSVSFGQILKTKRYFENVAFKRSTNLWHRQKIELISNLSKSTGFSCYNWFLLSSNGALTVRTKSNHYSSNTGSKNELDTSNKLSLFLRSHLNCRSIFCYSSKPTSSTH